VLDDGYAGWSLDNAIVMAADDPANHWWAEHRFKS
jgi:hypothetical protein